MRPAYRVKLSIDIALHFFLSAFISAWIYLNTGNVIYAAVFIFGGIFIDLDHLIDYFFSTNKFSLKAFLNSSYLKSGKVYLFLHSWEIGFIIFAVSMAVNSYGLLMLSLALSIHMFIDNTQRENPLFYFLSYRFYKKFDISSLLPEYNKMFTTD